ncbi:MAG: ABC transporter substrate-binding protein [bacterium]
MAEGEMPAAPAGVWTGKNLVIVIALLVVTNAVTGAAVFFSVPRAEVKALTVIGPWAGSEWEAFKPVLDEFSTQTGIDYQYTMTRQEDLRTILPTQFAAKRAPADLIFMVSSFIRDEAGPDGNAIDMTDLIDTADFNPGALDPITKDGKIYGGVYTGKIKPGFWYRQSFFTANNLPDPTTFTTFAEFQDLLSDIAGISGVVAPIALTGEGWPLSDLTEHFIATYGGAQMHRDLTDGTVSWTDASVKDLFNTYLVPLIAAGYFGEAGTWAAGDALERWWDGDFPLWFMGSWITGMVDDPSDLRVFSLPGGTDTGIVFGGDYFFIPTYTDQEEEAKMLFNWLASADGQTVQVRQGGHIATALGVDLAEYPEVDRGVAALMEGVEILGDMDDAIGSPFQDTFWSQLISLYASTDPAGDLDTILAGIDADAP